MTAKAMCEGLVLVPGPRQFAPFVTIELCTHTHTAHIVFISRFACLFVQFFSKWAPQFLCQHIIVFGVAGYRSPFGFWFLVCYYYDATQLTLHLQQERIQVVRSNSNVVRILPTESSPGSTTFFFGCYAATNLHLFTFFIV